MKKSLLSLLLAITMLVMLVLPASAATGSLTTAAKLSSDGTGFTVELIVKDNPGIIAMTGKLTYDSNVFKLTDVKNGEIFDSIFMSSQTMKVNPYQNIWMDATASEDIKTNGVLATYTFEVLKNAPIGESEIKFEITESVNFKKDSTSQFNGCSFKVNVKSNSGNSQSGASGSDSAANSDDKITNDQTLNVQKPLKDNTDTEDTSSNAQVSDETESEVTTIGEADDSDTDNKDKLEGKDRTLITIITIAAVLVLGLAITFTALYFRKKSANQNSNE